MQAKVIRSHKRDKKKSSKHKRDLSYNPKEEDLFNADASQILVLEELKDIPHMMILTPKRNSLESAEEAPRYLAVQPQVEPQRNESLLQIS